MNNIALKARPDKEYFHGFHVKDEGFAQCFLHHGNLRGDALCTAQ